MKKFQITVVKSPDSQDKKRWSEKSHALKNLIKILKKSNS